MPSMPEQTPPRSSSPGGPGLDSEDDKIDKLMRSSPIPDDDELPPNHATPDNAPPGEHNSDSASTSVLQQGVNGNTFQLLGVSWNEQAMLRRAAEKLKVHPYQRSLLQDFIKCSPAAREAQVMMAIFAVDNRLDQQAAAAPPFSVSDPLHCNIKNFIIAVLLSAKLAAYKGTIPCDHSLIMKERLHTPHTFDRDPHASKVLKEHVNHELSQARGKLKKLIKSGNDKNIFDFATALVNGTSCSVTTQLCGRVALLRKMFKVDCTDSFWGKVDDELAKIRTKAAGDPVKLTRYFRAILEADQKAYCGDDPSGSYTLPVSVTSADPWQTEVNCLLDGISGS